ncbi:MAG: AEC family transporter, partial [Anaerotignum sp.]|nr:AEC family transporter [Anaerotignum sp.]
MDAILVKACGFLFMIALGYVLKRIGLFSVDDSGVLSKIVLKITLPMAIISNFKGLALNSSFLVAIMIGFVVHFVSISTVLLLTKRKPAEQRAFYI